MERGYWIILSGTGGELDRIFSKTEEAIGPLIITAIRAGGWEMAPGDAIRVIEGESELV